MDIILENILRLKNDNGLTDRQFQIDLNLHTSAVAEWQKGKSKSYLKHLPSIAEYLHVSTEYLLGKTNIKKEAPTDLWELSNEEIELIQGYRKLKAKERKHVIWVQSKFLEDTVAPNVVEQVVLSPEDQRRLLQDIYNAVREQTDLEQKNEDSVST